MGQNGPGAPWSSVGFFRNERAVAWGRLVVTFLTIGEACVHIYCRIASCVPHASPLVAPEITADISAKMWPRGSSVDMLDEPYRTVVAVRMGCQDCQEVCMANCKLASLGDARHPSRFALNGRGRRVFCKVHQQAILPCIKTLCCAVRRAWICRQIWGCGSRVQGKLEKHATLAIKAGHPQGGKQGGAPRQ